MESAIALKKKRQAIRSAIRFRKEKGSTAARSAGGCAIIPPLQAVLIYLGDRRKGNQGGGPQRAATRHKTKGNTGSNRFRPNSPKGCGRPSPAGARASIIEKRSSPKCKRTKDRTGEREKEKRGGASPLFLASGNTS